MEYIKLNNGMEIPKLGIGTFMLSSEEAEKSVLAALENGYRHIDTANAYMNEKAVGRAMKKSGVPREEITLVTKLFPGSYKEADMEIDATLRRLDLDYIDILLLHQPYGKVEQGWKSAEKAVRDGKVKAIGVCNFQEKDMEKLLSYATIKPVFIQNECHPYYAEKDLIERYKEDSIHMEAWYPLGHGDKGLIGEPVFGKLASKYGKSKVQIILRWHMQLNHIAIPGSKNPEHIKSNIEIFDFALTEDEMKEIDALDGKKRFFNMPRPIAALMFANAKMNYDNQE